MNKALLFLLLLTSSCLGNSETESKGIDKVLSFYGGSAIYSRGIVRSTDADELQGKYYEIKISGVEEKMNRYFSLFKLPASNCAYLFYHALTPDEKKEYSFVRIISDNKNSSSKYDYSAETLDDFETAAMLAENSVNYMVDNNYKQFLFNGNPLASSKEEWGKSENLLINIDKDYGAVKEFSIQGFQYFDNDIKGVVKHFVRVSGVLVREKQNTDFSLIVDPTTSVRNEYLYGFSFRK